MTDLTRPLRSAPIDTSPTLSCFQQLSWLGEQLGTLEFVQGPGGNVSVKENGVLWVKASGARLRDLGQAGTVTQVSLGLARAAAADNPGARRQLFDLVPRPSMEVGFHVLPGRVVAHTHPTDVGLVVCSRRELPRRMAGETPVIDIPYTAPGFALGQVMGDAWLASTAESSSEVVFVLRNHGLVVISETAGRAAALTASVTERAKQDFRPAQAFPLYAQGYLDTSVVSLPCGVIRTLPRQSVKKPSRCLFPDAAVFARSIAVPAQALADPRSTETAQHCATALARARGPVLMVDPEGNRMLCAPSMAGLTSASEILAANDWIEDVLGDEAVPLTEGEIAEIVDLPAERYRQQQLNEAAR